MGQRSEIYILIDTHKAKKFYALYYQWNYGERMISRAAHLLEWLKCHKEYIGYETDHVTRIADTNFDMVDVVDHGDILKWYEEDNLGESWQDFVFNQDNNDGKLFIWLTDEDLKYCLTDDANNPLSAGEYIAWGDYEQYLSKSGIRTLNKNIRATNKFTEIRRESPRL